MRVVILGAGGCFGQNLAMYLHRFGYQVMGIGRSPAKPDPYSLGYEWVYRVYHLVNDFQNAWDAVENFQPQAIVNFAAHAGLVPQSWKYPEPFYLTNTILPIRIAERLPKDCRYIHIGSSEVYGSNNSPVDEEAPIRCSSPYAVSKAAADLHLMTLKNERITVIRPSNCYCPGQSLHRLIPRAVLAAISGKKMALQGSPSKSYMHAEDLSAAIDILLRKPQAGVFNVGPELTTNIHKIVSMVAAEFNLHLTDIAEITMGRANEDACFWIDSEKMGKLGWMPVMRLNEGIKDMADWGRKYADQIVTMSTEYDFRP